MKHVIVAAIGLVIAVPALAQTAAQLNSAEYQRLGTSGPPAAYSPPPMMAANSCAPGTRWVDAGYVKHGKWRPAGCYRR
jgi:hypothetical protein